MNSVQVLGVRVHAVGVAGLLDVVAGHIRADDRATLAYANVHVLHQAHGDPALTTFLNGVDLCLCDGAGVALGARLLGQPLPGRVTGADWIHDLSRRATDEGWRIAWLGGEPGATEAAARALCAAHPGLQIVHTDHGFHGSVSANQMALRALHASRPDIVLVGMGTPAQERWVSKWRASIDAPVVWCLGATHDVLSGRVSRGPRWLHQHQEWLARLWVEPRRLGPRYLVENPRFVLRLLGQRLGITGRQG